MEAMDLESLEKMLASFRVPSTFTVVAFLRTCLAVFQGVHGVQKKLVVTWEQNDTITRYVAQCSSVTDDRASRSECPSNCKVPTEIFLINFPN